MDSQSLDRMDSQLLDRADEARDLADTALYINHRREYDGYAFLSSSGFPWGSQWCWGFEFSAGKLVIHNPFVKIGPRISELNTAYITIGEGEWGVVCDVDWAMYGVGGHEFKTVTSQADMTKELENASDGSTSSERIPVAWFDGASLVLDYIHGMPYPHVLAGYYP